MPLCERPPNPPVEMQEFVHKGVAQEMPHRACVQIEDLLAASRTEAPRECASAAHAQRGGLDRLGHRCDLIANGFYRLLSALVANVTRLS
jgi:hypothetical protein